MSAGTKSQRRSALDWSRPTMFVEVLVRSSRCVGVAFSPVSSCPGDSPTWQQSGNSRVGIQLPMQWNTPATLALKVMVNDVPLA
jgi:hypothetical protein